MGIFNAVFLCLFVLTSGFLSLSSAINVSHDGRAVLINGQRRILISGAIHYPRSTAEMWPDLFRKAKEGGIDTIETYVFWNIHEPRRREYDFSGNRDIIRFLKTIQDAGLYAILRIGPYVCAEWNYGGFPVWLHNMPGIELRTDNEVFKNEMQNFTTLIVNMIKQEKLFASQGGPIILAQIENEYGNVIGSYGAKGRNYLQWCAKMATSLNIDIPWIMCQEKDAPQPMINTCNGYFCDGFSPNNPNSPKIWTENWIGWYKSWGERDPHRRAEDVAFAVARFYQKGGTLQNYYMYHGGTNFGRTTGGPYIATSYDYDGFLDEYGNINQPKWGHLKRLHSIIKSMETVLTYGDVTPIDFGNGVEATIYATNETSACFLSNRNEMSDETIYFQKNNYFLPRWSVSILPDCKQVAYNTAIVNTQTSIIEKMPNKAEEEPEQLNWAWRPEYIKDTLSGKGSFKADHLLEQKLASSDASDYLWYMTSVRISKHDPFYSKHMTLRIKTEGHGLYIYFNGELVGSQYATTGKYSFELDVPVTVKSGKNYITLLSVTVGLANYGAYFDIIPVGITGPVQLIGNGSVVRDLSYNQWTYEVGLNGEDKKIYDNKYAQQLKWYSDEIIIKRPMTWYKTTFKAPLGLEPVVVDLQGLGKGEAWVNGHSIGRYWPTVIAPSDGCEECDYPHFSKTRCATNCGEPTQRWYHVPRSFLHTDNNTLILFEEAGGNPTLVNFQTVTAGTICANVNEGTTLELSCQGGHFISDIQFASFGDPVGTCGFFEKGTCEADHAFLVVQKACVGRKSCSIDVSEATLGLSNCDNNINKRLAVQAVC
ncbi:beta-galactosidase 15-like [Magnolia sinica]|uniref:beta-galactosidase 15-like n=1 Tax=Magnolia sinica TaxID=86752 RepID=UPI00265AD22F|nr:beta-galactosidase 15-like [Magnolia sinica]